MTDEQIRDAKDLPKTTPILHNVRKGPKGTQIAEHAGRSVRSEESGSWRLVVPPYAKGKMEIFNPDAVFYV